MFRFVARAASGAMAASVGVTACLLPAWACSAELGQAAGAPDAEPLPPPVAAAEAAPIQQIEIVEKVKRLNEAREGIQTQTGASVYTLDNAAINAVPGGDNTLLNQVILQAPEVAQDSFGQFHVRGEHNGLQYRVNGIILPEGISVFGQSLDRPLPEAMHPHPMSPIRHRTPLPQPARPRFQNQAVLRYTLAASGISLNLREVVATQQLSLIRNPDAPICVRNPG